MTDADLSRLYPELAGQRRLADALRTHLEVVGSGITVEDPLGSAYAIARAGQRHCQVMLALRARSFGVDLWDRGVNYGHLWAPDLNAVALLIQRFGDARATTADLALLPDVEVTDAARAHEAGTLVDFQWSKYLSAKPSTWPNDRLHEVFILAASSRLRSLMPFVSLSRACFSTRTGHPYTRDCPAVEVLRDGRCNVFRPDELDRAPPVFTGDPDEAVRQAASLLPSSDLIARDGTADDEAA